MSEETKPMYVQCAVCGFWVTQKQPSCPNCGIVEPYDSDKVTVGLKEKPSSAISNLMWSVFFGGVTGLLASGLTGLVAWVLRGTGLGQDLAEWRASISWGAGLLMTGACFWASIYWNQVARRRRRDGFIQIVESLETKTEMPQHLRDTEEQLTQRIEELKQKGQDTTALEKALSTVREAMSVAAQQSLHARLMLHKIFMLRWQNKLEPLIVDQPMNADVAEWQRRLQEVEAIQMEGQKGAEWLAEQSDLLALPEGVQLQQAWTELLAGCERLKNELLARQAIAAAESVKPLDETMPQASQVGETAADALRHVLVTHDFGGMNQAVKDLRAQEARLQAEREQAEQRARQVQRI